jgi:hypothetical protein
MPHYVLAAKTLLGQVTARREGVKTTGGDPDGLNRIRAIEFDAKTSKWLTPILEACADPRIASLATSSKNRLMVVFVPTVKADDPTPFALDEADSVLNE